jgi:hypothetical protein
MKKVSLVLSQVLRYSGEAMKEGCHEDVQNISFRGDSSFSKLPGPWLAGAERHHISKWPTAHLRLR